MNIIICSSCDGEGKKKVYDDYRDWSYEKCSKCNGTGRVRTREYRYEVPLDFPEGRIYEVDNQIIKLIRGLEKNG